MKKIFKDILIPGSASIKTAMGSIDRTGNRVVYIVDKDQRFAGAVSDSEIRKAILKGTDIKDKVFGILNPAAVVLGESDLSNPYIIKRTVKRLLKRMPDSEYILILDNQKRPKDFARISKLIGKSKFKSTNHKNTGKRILIVGGAGYLGSVLARKLLSLRFKVKVLDLLLYGSDSIEGLYNVGNFELIEGDMRNISTLVRALNGVDAVVNLAAIVGDPACKNKPETAIETNYLANKALAEAAKYHQVNRFIYASTCSVYGAMSGSEKLTENSSLHPVSLYARSKIHSEDGILSLEDENFSPTILRMGTLYGYSARMRFDLVVNTMAKTAAVDKKIFVLGGGRQWRPLLNVEDAASAYARCLSSALEIIKGEIFNVGSEEQNYQIIEVAKIVKKCIPDANVVVDGKATDLRNYSVSFEKIRSHLKYKTTQGLEASVRRIKKAIVTGEIRDVDNPKYYNTEHSQ